MEAQEAQTMYSEWADSFNAQMYEQYAQAYPIYRETGKKLVELVGIRPGMSVVDLACGTGIVTERIVSALEGTGTVKAIDLSAAMLAIAAHKFPAGMVRFVHSSAETIDELLPEESVDVGTCNSAFWQTRTRDTIEALQKILKGGARFLFNLSLAGSLAYIKPTLQRPPSALLPYLMVQIAKDEFGYAIPQSIKWPRLTVEGVQRLLEGTSLILVSWEDVMFEETAEDAYAFFHIPVMTEAYLPGLDYATRLEVVDRAYQEFVAAHREIAVWRYEWRYYILEKNKRSNPNR
jgi:ubiquinone/menaquinone biosynthesis C-methylase UbiE